MSSINGHQQGGGFATTHNVGGTVSVGGSPSPMISTMVGHGGNGNTGNGGTTTGSNIATTTTMRSTGGAPGIPQQANSAVMYLDDVKREFIDKPDIYNEFLAVMKEFKSGGLDTVGVRSRVMELFRGHKKILAGFNAFLPPNCAITEQDMEDLQRSRPGPASTSTPLIAGTTIGSSPMTTLPRLSTAAGGQRSVTTLPPPPTANIGIAYSTGIPVGMDYEAHYPSEAIMSSFRGNMASTGMSQQGTPQTLHHGQFGMGGGPVGLSTSRSSTSGLTSLPVPPASPPPITQQPSGISSTMGLSSRSGPSLIGGYGPPSSMGTGSSGSLWPPLGPPGIMSGPPMGAHFPGSHQQPTQFGGPPGYANQPTSYPYQGPSMASFHAAAIQGHPLSHQQPPLDSRMTPSKPPQPTVTATAAAAAAAATMTMTTATMTTAAMPTMVTSAAAEQTNPEFTKAVDFVRRVRSRFANRPKIYEEFLETLRGGSADQVSKLSPEEVSRVSDRDVSGVGR